jgi:hypothetical protein
MRCFRLLGPTEGQHFDMADAVACQNVELFEASPQQAADSEAAGEPIYLGQVGIRCIHCLPGSAYSTVYPENCDSLAIFVQMLSDRHLSGCATAPPQVREICEQKAAQRQQDHEQRRQPAQDEERQQMALFDHFRFLAGNAGLVDKYPPKTGITFRDNAYGGQMEAQAERYSAEQPMRDPGGVPFQQPPPRRTAHQIMEGVASTPLARRSKHERDYEPSSGERREFMLQSADRREYPPSGGEREAGYPGAFQPHGHRYPPEGMQERTPGGQHRPMEHPESAQQQQTPQGPSQGESPYPQSPYGMPPPEFPYFQDMNGTWLCRYCSHVHPQYRDQGSVWASSPNPPPGQFIDQHLGICRYYQQGPPPPSYYDAPPPPPSHMSPYNYGPAGSQYGGQYPPPGWGQSAGPGGHYPPTDAPYPYHPGPPGADQAAMYAPPPEREPQPPSRPSRGASRLPIPSVPSDAPDHESLKAIDVLVKADTKNFGTSFAERESRGQLVLDEDKLLLTEYFYHLMRQLRLCRFAEADRKTRGGKRESIKIGYGGLQCVHCTDAPNSRKFFWSNVDRLANSFAEIPGHVLKCRRCPVPVKNALISLKKRHPEQMARLPRGSQKVFFRRMWRRLHDEDPENEGSATNEGKVPAAAIGTAKSNDENVAPSNSKVKSPTVKTGTNQVLSPDPSTDESTLLIERTTVEAAKALAQSSTRPPVSPSSRIMLALAEDKEWLSDMDCFIRKNLEVFCATEEDVEIAQQDRKYPINNGQVGIRCIHCAMKNGTAARGTAVAYPYSINGIYESVREFQRLHLESCPQLPDKTRAKLAGFKGSSSLSSVLRRYYVLAAKALGMLDTPSGIRSGGDCVPVGSSTASAFQFNDWRTKETQPPPTSGEDGFLQTAVTPLESRKRKTSLPDDMSPSSGGSTKKSRDK